MLRSYLTASLVSFSSLGAWAQAPALPADFCRTECFYRLTYRPDSTVETTRTDELRLQIGRKLSRCESRNAVYGDSVLEVEINRMMKAAERNGEATMDLSGTDFATRRPSMTAVIYKVPSARQVAVYERVGEVFYTYQEPATLLTWTTTPDKATVAGYACQRATTTLGGRIWEAWFTREVPVSEGPYKFYGLPGLIVKVSDTRNSYRFELVRLRQLTAPAAIAPPQAAKKTSRQKFRQAKVNYDAQEMMQARGDAQSSSPGEEADAQRREQAAAKERNNPLELQ
ncbi:MAG: GLPGLI family protein [Janthinobacterium lividum]